ncbi:ABC transporter ATP-binding protein [Paraurantiacibacter namhicola]|uniref:Hemin import ATP-binding protein HmuV n=1 Tax=Paraurantiacibacter namhicola TaxID=645517 RepID=A0A1C7D8I1_9SPHN|nr:ABC transporter ATP-binding protein [Paraurantiacibacter namhicola]ANU07662.1 Hemin import ATP-binding protein HmuV [Paraurantiacibacter namhicola]
MSELHAKALSLAGRLSDVSASFAPGTITAICGPNGAGKSTLLHMLAGLLKPDRGEAALDGHSVNAMEPQARARAIGFLPQDAEVAWDVSAANLVALGRLPHRLTGRSEDAEAIRSAMETADVAALAHRPMSTLSGGEKARVLLARVLAGRPHWILADEPLAALDLGQQIAQLRHLRRIADGGTGIVLVLHDLSLAMNHADRVLVLDGGALVADGPPAQALDAATIARVWQVDASWIEYGGTHALAIGNQGDGAI